MLVRRFLWGIAIIIMIVIAAAFAYSLFGVQLLRAALVPSAAFSAVDAGGRPDYARLDAWAAHPGLKTDAARWTPKGYFAAPHPGVAVFYVLPVALGQFGKPYSLRSRRLRSRQFAGAPDRTFPSVPRY